LFKGNRELLLRIQNAKVKLLAAVGAENHTALIPAITSMTAPDSVTGISREVTKTELPTYKVINYDSTISEMKASENTPEINANPSDVRVTTFIPLKAAYFTN